MDFLPDWLSAPNSVSAPCALPSLAADLLPVVRRILQMGEGPTWLVRVIQLAGEELFVRAGWTDADEQTAHHLARLAARLLISLNHTALRETVTEE
jgi:hypothetical protein